MGKALTVARGAMGKKVARKAGKVALTVQKSRNKIRPLNPQTIRLCVENVANACTGVSSVDLGTYSRVSLQPAALRGRGVPPPSRMKMSVHPSDIALVSRPILMPIQATAEQVSSPGTRFQLQTLGTYIYIQCESHI